MVSIILATANRAEALQNALATVFAQTLTEFELLVLDCASEDTTEAVATTTQDSRVRYFYLEQADRAGACAEGLRRARGQKVVFMDVHASWQPQCLAVLNQALTDAPGEVGAAYAGAECQDEAGEAFLWLPDTNYPEGRISKALFAGPCIAPASMLVRAELLKPLQQVNRRSWLRNDDVLSLWLSAKTAFVPVPQRLVTLRELNGHQARGIDPVAQNRGSALFQAMSELPGIVPGHYGRRCIASFHGRCAEKAAHSRHTSSAIGHALRALLYTPFSFRAWRLLVRMAARA